MMESIQAVKKEEEKLKNKYISYKTSISQSLDDLIEEINVFKQSLNEGISFFMCIFLQLKHNFLSKL